MERIWVLSGTFRVLPIDADVIVEIIISIEKNPVRRTDIRVRASAIACDVSILARLCST